MAKKKKAGGAIVRRGVTVLLALILICAVTFVITVNWIDVRARETETVPALFGNGFVPITSDVAQEPFVRGDLVVMSQNGPYAVGDCVLIENTTDLPNEELIDGRFVLARILAENDGSFQIVTRTSSPQLMTITPAQVLGTVAYVVKGVGTLFDFVRMPVGFFVMILVPFFVLIVWIAVLSFLAHRRRIKEAMVQEEADETESEQILRIDMINENVSVTEETVDLQKNEEPKQDSEQEPKQKTVPESVETVKEPVPAKVEEDKLNPQPPVADILKETIAKKNPQPVSKQQSTRFDYEKGVDALLDELMAEISKSTQTISEPQPPVTQTSVISETKTQPVSSEIKTKQESGVTSRPSFMDMTTDEIIEQFTMELEEARLRPLEDIQSDDFDVK